MAGYDGMRMSNNAVYAYGEGKKPYSKWTKKDIIASLEAMHVNSDIIDLAKKYNADVVKDVFLKYAEWHHTSGRYNMTDFYEVKALKAKDIKSLVSSLEKSKAKYSKAKAKKKAEKSTVDTRYMLATVQYREPYNMGKSYNYYEEEGVVHGNWCYFVDGKKKKVNSIGFAIVKIIEELPDDYDIDTYTSRNVERSRKKLNSNIEGEIDDPTPEERTQSLALLEKAKPLLKDHCLLVKARYSVYRSNYSAKHTNYESTGIIRADKCYLESGRWKYINSSSFWLLEILEQLPLDYDIESF